GQISLPLIGALKASGNTEAELEQLIAHTYSDAKLIQNAQVSVTIAEAHGREISVIGAVAKPGAYQLARSDSRLIDVLAQAGGISGSPQHVVILRQEGDAAQARRIEIPLAKLISG